MVITIGFLSKEIWDVQPARLCKKASDHELYKTINGPKYWVQAKKKKRKEMYRDNESSLSEYTLLLKLTDTLLVTMLINHLIINYI